MDKTTGRVSSQSLQVCCSINNLSIHYLPLDPVLGCKGSSLSKEIQTSFSAATSPRCYLANQEIMSLHHVPLGIFLVGLVPNNSPGSGSKRPDAQALSTGYFDSLHVDDQASHPASNGVQTLSTEN